MTHPGVVARESLSFEHAPVLALEAQAVAYWHPGLMTAFQLRAGPALRITGPRRGTWGIFAHAGAMHGFWTSPTWAVEDGEPRRVRLAGDSWGVTAFGLEFGRELREVSRAGISAWAVRPQMGLRFPTFHGVGIDLAVEVTVRFGGET